MDISTERRNRIRAAVFAYAYEIMGVSLIPDDEFDKLCLKIRPEISTGNKRMDKFYQKEFAACTGMWIHKHPEIEGIKRIYNSLVAPIEKSNVDHSKIPKEFVEDQKGKMNVSDLTGYNSRFMNMLYIASLGFPIVPGVLITNGYKLSFIQHPDGMDFTLEDPTGDKQIKFVKFTEIFK